MQNDATQPGPEGELPTWSDPPGLGRSMIVGSTIGVILSFVGVTIGMLAVDVEMSSALGLGLFVAFWGGLGFGTMVGGVVYAFGLEKNEHEMSHEGAGSTEADAGARPVAAS